MNINGLEVTADPTTSPMAQRKILRAAAVALSTTVGLDWSTCGPVEAAIVPDTGKGGVARWRNLDGLYRVEVETYVPIRKWSVEVNAVNMRHELFHHFDFAGGLTPEQRHELFVVFTGREPNSTHESNDLVLPAWRPHESTDPRYPWPPGSFLWNGGLEYKTRPCEDFAYICEEIYDGERDGLRVNRPNLKGRKKEVAARVQEILGTSVDVWRAA